MKKKLMTLIIAAVIAVIPVTSVYADSKDDKIKELEMQVKQMQKTIDELQERLEKYEQGADMEAYLLEKGVLTGERVEMGAEMIGAISGFKYDNAEIYKFDTESEQYKTLESGQPIPLEGFDGVTLSATAVNNGYALMGEPSEDVITAFKEFK